MPVYVFDEINRRKYEARVNGKDSIDLGMGNPDLPTPLPIVKKLREAVLNPRNNRYSVSRWILSLRRELSHWYLRKFGVKLDPDRQVVVTLGARSLSKDELFRVCSLFVSRNGSGGLPRRWLRGRRGETGCAWRW